MSPRVLFVSHPGIGHVRPLFPVARALVDYGATVAFAVAESFRPYVAGEGFATVTAGLDWTEARAEQAFPELSELAPWDRGAFLLRDVFADIAAHATARAVLDLVGSWQPDVIVRTDYEFGAQVAAEVRGVPVVTVSVALPMAPGELSRLVGHELAYLRSAFGLVPHPATPDVGGPYLTYAPPSLLPDRPGLVRMRAPVASGTTELPRPVLDLPDRPTVYVSLGTVFNARLDVFRTVLAGLREQAVNVIVTVGPTQDPAALGPQPPTVVVARYIPQDAVFGVAELFVTHSPFFTALSALQAGLPLLMVPLSADQPAHALRFAELGAGLVLRPAELAACALPTATPVLDAESVAAAAGALLAESRYRTRAAELAAEIQALPDVTVAARTICAVAASVHG